MPTVGGVWEFGVFVLMVFWVLEIGKEVWRDDVAV
jgi:hypothetical protein